MYIDPQQAPPSARQATAAGEPDPDRFRLRDADDERDVRRAADPDEDDDFECVCHIHVETRDGRTFYRLVLERDSQEGQDRFFARNGPSRRRH